MTENNHPEPARLTDAEFAAEAAAAALREGRYELGRALANLAATAARLEVTAEPRMVPLVGTTRYEPARGMDHLDAEAHIAAAEARNAAAAGPTGNGDADLAAAAQTDLFGEQKQEQQTAIVQTARCATEVAHGSYLDDCRQPVYWQAGNIGDRDHPAKIAGWYHVNPDLDRDHVPTVRTEPGAH